MDYEFPNWDIGVRFPAGELARQEIRHLLFCKLSVLNVTCLNPGPDIDISV